MSRFIQSEDDESSSSLSSSSHSSLHNEPSPPPQTKIPLSTSIILEKKVPVEQQQDILNPSMIDSKIMIRFAPIGSTPSIQPRVFKISSTQTISTLNKFLCKKLKHKGTLHLYIQNSFMPLPDEQIGSLYNLFKTNNELIISYCNTVAFG